MGSTQPEGNTDIGIVREGDVYSWLESHYNSPGATALLPPMDTSRGQIHIITCTGIGDTAWVWAKFKHLSLTREVYWWFPDAGAYNRIQPYCQLCGMRYGGIVPVDTKQILEYPGEFEEKDFEGGGIFYVHANRHIESGLPLYKGAPNYVKGQRVWHDWLPFINPAPPLTLVKPGERPPQASVNEGVWKWAYPGMGSNYFTIHMASQTYCEGNHFPKHWANLIAYIEAKYAPVVLIGAAWDEDFIKDVCQFYTPKRPPCIGQSLGTALSIMVNSGGIIGVDSGMTIMATYYGMPALRAYPRWLRNMPGTFEDTNVLHDRNKWCFMDELMERAYDWVDALYRDRENSRAASR